MTVVPLLRRQTPVLHIVAVGLDVSFSRLTLVRNTPRTEAIPHRLNYLIENVFIVLERESTLQLFDW
jgi:hypothetical protein